MVQFISGSRDTLNGLLYGEQHPDTLEFLQQQMSTPSQVLQGSAQAFMSGARNVYERFNGSEAMRIARAAKRNLEGIWQKNMVRPLRTIGETQHAPDVMIRYLMSHPELQKRYEAQTIEGYEGRWTHMEAGHYGQDNYNYRRVTEHVGLEDANGDIVAWSYSDELHDGERELEFQEKLDILETQERLISWVQMSKEDPTSRFNARL